MTRRSLYTGHIFGALLVFLASLFTVHIGYQRWMDHFNWLPDIFGNYILDSRKGLMYNLSMETINTAVETKIQTPIEIAIPFAEAVDHGMVLVHELGGKPRNYLHEVSIPEGYCTSSAYMQDAGYTKDYGYRKDGQQYWVWRKAFPLSVSRWN